MTPTKAKDIRKEHDLSLSDMARVLNLEDPDRNGADAVRKMEAGQRRISGPIIRILQMLEAGRFEPQEILS